MGNVDNREFISDTFVFDRSIYESTQPDGSKKGVLRIIKGPIAEWDNLNRNNRKYSEKLWDKTMASSYVQEQLRYQTLYGEANHPTDRYEVDFSRVSHSIVEMWKVPASNQIFATIYILDTPLGRILNTLYEAGGILGYSTRAGGNLIQRKGYVEVDENTYNFITLDAVPYPSVESARPSVVEGVEQEIPKKVLSEEVHEKLCSIIKESTSENKEVIKSLIYSLESYDMTKEKELLEGSQNFAKNEPDKETTMSLLKGSSLQIDTLKVANQTLKAERESLIKENAALKENLSSSVSSITELLKKSKDVEREVSESETRLNDTIRELKGKITDLEGALEEKNSEIECLESASVAYRALKYENEGLKNGAKSERDRVLEGVQEEKRRLEEELNDAYKEISTMVSESAELTSKIESLLAKVEGYEDKMDVMKSEIKTLKESNAAITEGASQVETVEAENIRLREDIKTINESMEAVRTKSDYYKNELLSVICSQYNLTVESVARKLPIGFTKSDVYCLCEEMSNSLKNGVDYTSVIDKGVSRERKSGHVESESRISPRFNSGMWVDRRGISKINK